jgi:hypothetical protein
MYNLNMRYEVPQFIDVEDKIFGPLTFNQAIYLAGSAGISFAIFYVLGKIEVPVVVRLVFIAPPLALGIALAFIKINRRPFVYFMESFFYFFISAKRYIWKKRDKSNAGVNSISKDNFVARVEQSYVPKVSKSRIKDLARTLDMDVKN